VGPFGAIVIIGQVVANASVYCNAAVRLPIWVRAGEDRR
jgi:uncharacterized protein (DUF983 family)